MENKLYIVFYKHNMFVWSEINTTFIKVIPKAFKTEEEARKFVLNMANQHLTYIQADKHCSNLDMRLGLQFNKVEINYTRNECEQNYRTYYVQEMENPYQEELDAK